VGSVIQAKLTVNQPGDIYEQEADRMAAQVMTMPQSGAIQREIDPKKEKEKIQMMPSLQRASVGNMEVGGNLEGRLNSSKGGGSPLPDDVRSFMEPRFGADFSQVRVHTGGESVQMNQDLNAQAFTHRQDVYFGAGKAPAKDVLTAHELTHVMQQSEMSKANSSIQLKQENERPLADIQGLAMYELLPKLEKMPSGILTDEEAAGLVGGTRLVLAMRAVKTKTDKNLVDFLIINKIVLSSLPPDQYGNILSYLATPKNSSQANESTVSSSEKGRSISDMSAVEKLTEAISRAKFSAAVSAKLWSLITPKVLAIGIISFIVVYGASQFTPVGWAANIGIALTAVFVGSALFTAINHLVRFADARSATTQEELDQAGAELAQAFAEIAVDAIILFVTHGVGGGPKGGVPFKGTPTTQVMFGITEEGRLVAVAVETVPAQVISTAQAIALGAKAAPTLTPLLSRGSGSGSSVSGSRIRDFEPPIRDRTGKIHDDELGRDIPRTPYEMDLAIKSWSKDELEASAIELEKSIAARKAEQLVKGEDSVGKQGQPVGAPHRVRIGDEEDLLRRILKKLSGS
jgi:hypothetical protein